MTVEGQESRRIQGVQGCGAPGKEIGLATQDLQAHSLGQEIAAGPREGQKLVRDLGRFLDRLEHQAIVEVERLALRLGKVLVLQRDHLSRCSE